MRGEPAARQPIHTWAWIFYDGANSAFGTIIVTAYFVIIGIACVHSKLLFFLLSGCLGLGLGSAQSATRVLLTQFVPLGQEGQFFAFKGICGKFSSIVNPILFGTISLLTSNQRWAVASLLFFFVSGLIVVYSIDEVRGKETRSLSS